MKTMKQLAQEVLDVQDACNLSGVVHGWSRAITNLRETLELTTGKSAGTETINKHPINKLWADKCASLAGVQLLSPSGDPNADLDYSAAYVEVCRLAEGS